MKRLYLSGEYCAPLSEQETNEILIDALGVLSECGVDFEDENARQTLAKLGARVSGNTVRFDPNLVKDMLGLAPKSAKLYARNPAYDVELGTTETVATPIYGTTHVLDPDGTKRDGTLSDLVAFHKMAQASAELQNVGSNIVEPTDIPPALRHLETMRSVLVNCDKSFMPVTSSRDAAVSALGLAGVRAEDSVAMARIALGEKFDRGASMVGVATCVTALTWAAPALDAMRIFAESGQAIMLAPFAVIGANAAAEPRALLTQITAEILSALVYCQAIRPNTIVLFGPHFAMRSDRRDIPQVAVDRMLAASGQIARLLSLPFRASGGLTNAPVLDVQSATEASDALNTSLMAGAQFLFHAAGWLENGLTISKEKFEYDCQLLAKTRFRQQGLDLSGGANAKDALVAWGAGKSHMEDPATQDALKQNYQLSTEQTQPDFIELTASARAELDTFVRDRSAALEAS
ncbi:trimethylamine methyltransferase family protein [Cognatishimia sp. SS12]|uniref:trimethylamine methyltransferase family protein n=1 Tax=Cognatishimia sp. SS12 TaxID=2979465 RepID=UPI00232C3218|nr:trimethylamine methyltransferase family protein [Cognatishimia sp. SS12]MDC0738074.1 trimethylamine methyltransferase family protein [Cognatishimia sp. SS12]